MKIVGAAFGTVSVAALAGMTVVAAAPAAAIPAPDKKRRRPASTNRSHRLIPSSLRY